MVLQVFSSEFFRDQEKLFKNPGFSLVGNRLDQTEKQWFWECSPESLDFDEQYYNFLGPVFLKISAFKFQKMLFFEKLTSFLHKLYKNRLAEIVGI